MGERIEAAGGLLWRPGPAGPEFCLVHRPRYDDWSLPKGKLEPGERPLRAAVREVLEETGVAAVVGRRLTTQEYTLGPDRKVVDYWSMTPGVAAFRPSDEVDSLDWQPLPRALELLSYQRDREFVAGFAAEAVPTAVVLLVRHAKAGSRSKWSGADELRPLDSVGQRQADGLRHTLRWFAPERVSSAEPLRCVQTVAPLAADLGLPVQPEPGLSEEAYEQDPETAPKVLAAAAAAGGRTVLCSQGGVIPGVLRRLAAEHGVRIGRKSGSKIPARKASVWTLSFVDSRLVAADYYPDLATAW